MSILKPITLLLIAAIANPMCCCLSFAEVDLDAAHSAKADPHACCQKAEEASQKADSAPTGDHDCFHEEIESYQFSDSKGTAGSISATPALHLLDYVEASSFFITQSPVSLAQSADHADCVLRQSGISYSQKYCVFIL